MEERLYEWKEKESRGSEEELGESQRLVSIIRSPVCGVRTFTIRVHHTRGINARLTPLEFVHFLDGNDS